MWDAPSSTQNDLTNTLPSVLRLEVVDSEAGFEALGESWAELARATPGSYFLQSQDWCRLSWRHFGDPSTDSIKILTGWVGARLIAVWPFRQRTLGRTRRIEILGCGIGDIADPIINPAFETPELCRCLLDILRAQADVIELSCLAADSVMAETIRGYQGLRYDVLYEDYVVEPNQWPNWDAFLGHYSQKMREGLRRRRRNLEKSGLVKFESVAEPLAQEEAVDWLLAQKREWCRRNFVHRDWFFRSESRAFLIEALKTSNALGRAEIFVLRRDGVITACGVNLIDEKRVCGFLIAHDTELQPFAPGMLLVEDTLRYGYARGLPLEMGIGKSEFKDRWATKIGLRVTFTLAPTPRGIWAITPAYIGYRWSLVRRQHVGPWLKAILSRERIDRIKAIVARLRGEPRAG